MNSLVSVAATAALFMALSTVVESVKINENMPYIRMKDLKGIQYPEKAQWMSVDESMEFLPVDDLPETPRQKQLRQSQQQQQRERQQRRRQLDGEDEDGEEDGDGDTAGAYDEYNPYSVQPFVEGISEYDEYQQAWRMLGFMIDCHPVDTDYYESHSASGDVTEDGCARYVLWAAYVDLEYEGGGIGEYQYWNRTSNSWDDTACAYAKQGSGSHDSNEDGNNNNNNDYESRCAKMDCHKEDTHFSLLGFFKHRNYDDWMEQLFKHEGMCVWTDEEYAFMKNARKAWPQGCVNSGTKTEEGETIYYDLKPRPSGRIAVGLYTDTQCVTEYSTDTDVVEALLGNFFMDGGSHDSGDGNYDFSGETLAESYDRWNSAFDVWAMCHPCVAHDLENTGGDKYLDDDDANYYYYDGQYYYYYDNNGNRRRADRKLGGEYAAEGDVFECYDDAGYTNVNQCMKFSAKTVMQTATFRDMSLGRVQNSLVESPLSGYLNSRGKYRKEFMSNFWTYCYFILTSTALLFAGYVLVKAILQEMKNQKERQESGMMTGLANPTDEYYEEEEEEENNNKKTKRSRSGMSRGSSRGSRGSRMSAASSAARSETLLVDKGNLS